MFINQCSINKIKFSKKSLKKKKTVRDLCSKGCKCPQWWGLLGFCFPSLCVVKFLGRDSRWYWAAPNWGMGWCRQNASCIFLHNILDFWVLHVFLLHFFLVQSFPWAVFFGLWLFIYCSCCVFLRGKYKHWSLLALHLADVTCIHFLNFPFELFLVCV